MKLCLSILTVFRLLKDTSFSMIALVLLLLSVPLSAQEVLSPDGSIAVKVSLESGKPFYEVSYNSNPVLETSPLGMESSIGSFASGLVNNSVNITKIDEQYTLPNGKTSVVHYTANEMTIHYINEAKDSLAVIFRVSDSDIALSYRISSRSKYRITIEREVTGFNFPSSATVFATHQAKAGTGFGGSKPSYEEEYILDVPVDTKSQFGLGFTFPALFRLGNNGWALISETGVSGKYTGSRLSDPTSEGLYTIAFPDEAENDGIGDATVSGSLPLNTPWRTITIGKTLAPIVESTVATDVVKPLYDASQVYKPGRSTWSWLLWQDQSMNEDDQRTFIDLASEMNLEYILIDALWDANIGREKMKELVAYARSKNVEVFLWYNSNGYWNDAPQSPKNFMDSTPIRQNEMAWLQSIGVKGIKVDFFGGDKQVTMKYYEDILTDANNYGLMLNFHGATIPRGWERMYPNYMTSEAITSSENLIFSQGFSDKEALNSTVFSIIRNSIGPMDFGPVLLNKVFSRDQRRGSKRKTTDTFQLATAVLYQSPMQFFGVTPNNLEEQPDYALDFLKTVPTVWDEIRFIDGYPGKFVVLARRSGMHWYICATHAGTESADMTISLPFLEGKTLDLFYDKEDRSAGLRKITVEDDGNVDLSLAPGGGALLIYKP
ncbi:glycoside hydrolase family 97 catalytic domain-containing protein [Candidatus Latescibacterota bacterium]